MNRIAIFALMAPLALACSSSGVSESVEDLEEGASAASIRLYEKDTGKTIQIEEGRKAYLYLNNDAPDHEWKVSLTDRTYGYPDKTLMNASNRTRFTFVTKRDNGISSLIGQHTVNFSYVKTGTWDAEREVSITLDIVPKG